MQIDWFTLVAQVVNLLILLVLLKKFLFDPVMEAMERREQTIAGRLDDADEQRRDAERQREELLGERREQQRRREEELQRARREVDERREQWRERARREVDERRRGWVEGVRRQRQAFLRDLRRRTAEGVVRATRRALGEMADRELQAQMAATFARRVGELPDEQRRRLAEALAGGGGGLTVRSSFDLGERERARLSEALEEVIGAPTDPAWERADDLVCGLQLRAGGHELAWSLDGYLEDLAEDLDRRLDELAEGDGPRQEARP